MAIFKIILVVALLMGMMIVLLSIGKLSSDSFHGESDNMDDFRREVDEKEDVIGSANIFRSLIGAPCRSSRRINKKD